MKTDLMENIDNPKPCPRCGNGDVHARLLDTDEFGYIACTHHYVNWGCELDVKIEIPEGSTEEEKIRIAKAYIKAWNDMSRDGSVDWHRASGEKIIKRAAEKILVGVKVLLSMPKD